MTVATPVDLLVALKTLGFGTWGIYGWLERARTEAPVTRFVDRYNSATADVCRTLALHVAKLPKSRPHDGRDAVSVRAAYPAEEVEQAIFKAYCKALETGVRPHVRSGPFAHVYFPGKAQYARES